MSNFVHAPSFANARKVDVSERQVKKLGQYETQISKSHLLIFPTNNRLLAGTIYIRFLINLKAIYRQKKMKEIDFLTPFFGDR